MKQLHEENDTKKATSYGSYQNSIYAAGLLTGLKPLVTTDPNKLEAQARQKLKPEHFNYVAGGAGEGATMNSNRLAFRQWKVVPRMLKDVTSAKDLSVKLFGESYRRFMLSAMGIFKRRKQILIDLNE